MVAPTRSTANKYYDITINKKSSQLMLKNKVFCICYLTVHEYLNNFKSSFWVLRCVMNNKVTANRVFFCVNSIYHPSIFAKPVFQVFQGSLFKESTLYTQKLCFKWHFWSSVSFFLKYFQFSGGVFHIFSQGFRSSIFLI